MVTHLVTSPLPTGNHVEEAEDKAAKHRGRRLRSCSWWSPRNGTLIEGTTVGRSTSVCAPIVYDDVAHWQNQETEPISAISRFHVSNPGCLTINFVWSPLPMLNMPNPNNMHMAHRKSESQRLQHKHWLSPPPPPCDILSAIKPFCTYFPRLKDIKSVFHVFL